MSTSVDDALEPKITGKSVLKGNSRYLKTQIIVLLCSPLTIIRTSVKFPPKIHNEETRRVEGRQKKPLKNE